ncbi:MAG: hypothetical protein JJ973_08465 [Rhodospirillales bacterium]|nr:hypothetical protein [Rhodospirillales bacterium]
MTSNKKPTTLKLRLSALVFTVVIIFATLELFSQVIYQTREDIANFFHVGDLLNLSNRLDPYEMAVPGDAFHWVLRPGYSADRSAVAELKKAQGKELGAQAFSADQNETGRSVSGITVNQSGFRGEALRDLEKFPRVLMLGDSVTFGLGTETYPHVVAGELLEKNIQVEIINGGVEGYGVRNLLKEVPRCLAGVQSAIIRSNGIVEACRLSAVGNVPHLIMGDLKEHNFKMDSLLGSDQCQEVLRKVGKCPGCALYCAR